LRPAIKNESYNTRAVKQGVGLKGPKHIMGGCDFSNTLIKKWFDDTHLLRSILIHSSIIFIYIFKVTENSALYVSMTVLVKTEY